MWLAIALVASLLAIVPVTTVKAQTSSPTGQPDPRPLPELETPRTNQFGMRPSGYSWELGQILKGSYGQSNPYVEPLWARQLTVPAYSSVRTVASTPAYSMPVTPGLEWSMVVVLLGAGGLVAGIGIVVGVALHRAWSAGATTGGDIRTEALTRHRPTRRRRRPLGSKRRLASDKPPASGAGTVRGRPSAARPTWLRALLACGAGVAVFMSGLVTSLAWAASLVPRGESTDWGPYYEATGMGDLLTWPLIVVSVVVGIVVWRRR